MATSPSLDRNLIFGILAVQMSFIKGDELISAMNAWLLNKERSLGQILLEQKRLGAEQIEAIDRVIELHLRQHQGDAGGSLRSVASAASIDLLQAFADRADDVGQSICQLSTETRHKSTLSANGSMTPAHVATNRNGSRYHVVQFHTQGGLGNIYLAEDSELNRQVALKEIKPEHADDPASQNRFIFEAEITGRLDHPGVVPVYGKGVYADGRPYYAMRFIRGDDLKKAIERFHACASAERSARRLEFRQLVRRFVDAANAIAYAHSRGVVHRDIKPANIMLGLFGETLVVDWGVAKTGAEISRNGSDGDMTADPVLRPASSGTNPYATQQGAVVGTIHYMSYEQAAGRIEQVGPASDIYSLGATLYTIITCKKPYHDLDAPVVLKLKANLTPPVPARQVNPQAPAALEAVCLKAMSCQPAERYRSALELAADVENWLADEPVSAYREPLTTRAARWARRHRTGVVAGAVLLVSGFLALGVGTGLLWREQKRTQDQRDVAEHNWRIAQENDQLGRDLSFNTVTLIAGAEAKFAAVPALYTTRSEILVTASRAFARYLESDPDNVDLRKRAAQVFHITANVHRLNNAFEDARTLYLESIRLRQGLAVQFPDDSDEHDALAATLRDYAKLQSNAGGFRAAQETLGRAIAIEEDLTKDHPEKAGYRRDLASALLNQANVLKATGEFDKAKEGARRAAQLYKELSQLPPGKTYPYDPLFEGASLNLLAVSDRERGDLKSALLVHEQAINLLAAQLKKVANSDFETAYRDFLASARLERARTLMKAPGNQIEAETLLDDAIKEWVALSKKYTQVGMYKDNMGFGFLVRAQLFRELDVEKARRDLAMAVDVLEKRHKQSPEIPGLRVDLGNTYLELARCAKEKDEASEWLRKAIDTLEAGVKRSPDHWETRRARDAAIDEKGKAK